MSIDVENEEIVSQLPLGSELVNYIPGYIEGPIEGKYMLINAGGFHVECDKNYLEELGYDGDKKIFFALAEYKHEGKIDFKLVKLDPISL